jgi:hypothetical protein
MHTIQKLISYYSDKWQGHWQQLKIITEGHFNIIQVTCECLETTVDDIVQTSTRVTI